MAREAHHDNHCFSADYAAARAVFRCAAEKHGARLESHSIAPRGPNGEELALDAAYVGPNHPGRLLILSAGLHGVEGFFGSAVQIAALRGGACVDLPHSDLGVLLLHALNPHGFAWVRRSDEANVDPNRNFLLAGQEYLGCSASYRKLDAILNPRTPPSQIDWFGPRMLAALFSLGRQPLVQAVSSGQYEFPRGIFFGGSGPCATHRILAGHMSRWLEGARRVLHLDFHTGLGRFATYKLLLESAQAPRRLSEFRRHFGERTVAEFGGGVVDYVPSGGLGAWTEATFADRDYTYLCAEFGTHSPLAVLAGLRAENQAHHWGQPDDPGTLRAKRRLKEVFCPASKRWRERVVTESLDLVRHALGYLAAPTTVDAVTSG